MMKTLLNLLLFWTFPVLASAQQVEFRLFTPADGLAGNNSETVAQDEQGLKRIIK